MAKETVIIGCKLPNGLHLEHNGTVIVLKGAGSYLLPNADRKFKNPNLVEGDSYTIVDKDFADAWFKAHSDYAPVKSGAVYRASNMSEFAAKARDMADVKTGFEKLDPARTKILGTEPLTDGAK